jgi:hypothetical protein
MCRPYKYKICVCSCAYSIEHACLAKLIDGIYGCQIPLNSRRWVVDGLHFSALFPWRSDSSHGSVFHSLSLYKDEVIRKRFLSSDDKLRFETQRPAWPNKIWLIMKNANQLSFSPSFLFALFYFPPSALPPDAISHVPTHWHRIILLFKRDVRFTQACPTTNCDQKLEPFAWSHAIFQLAMAWLETQESWSKTYTS